MRISAFLLFVLLAALSAKAQETTTDSRLLQSELDTFSIGKWFIEVEPVRYDEFEKLPTPLLDTSESAHLRTDADMVQREGRTLKLKTMMKTIHLTDNIVDDDNYAEYSYKGFLPELGQYLVAGTYYEWFSYLLIDRETGDTTYVPGLPIVSPDKKYFICGNTDLIAGFTFNGLELYSNTHKPQQVAARELIKWGPEEIKWITKNELMMKVSVADFSAEQLEHTEYFRLRIKNP